MDSIPCDVVILPEPLLASKAIEASQKLKQFNGYYTLEDGTCFPHASLYMLELKVEDIPQVEARLATIAQAFSPLHLEAYQYDHTMGFIDAEYKRTTEVDDLQRQVVEALNPLRHGMRKKDQQRMLTAEGAALENFQKYGYKSVGELFRPHVSFTRLLETNDAALEVLGDVTNFSGAFLRLGLFEMGDNGTCIREIRTFDFSD